MTRRNPTRQQVQDESVELKSRLEETEETLRAIRQYMVDAFVVTRSGDTQILTLNNADFPYRMMVESMNEGAVTLIPDGTIFYCNPHFGEMVQLDPEKLIGIQFRDLIRPEEQAAFDTLLTQAQQGARGEFCLQAPNMNCLPVQLSIYQLSIGDASGISIIATDMTERFQAEEKIRTLASQLTMAEQEERHRISQILHDDLQQRLFAIKTQLSFLLPAKETNSIAPVVRDELRQVQRLLSDAIGITRSLSIDLSPIVLQGEGLAEAIYWLAAQMKAQHGLDVQVDATDNLNISDNQMRLLLFQTMRELLFNIVKHAGTLQAKVT